MSVRDVEVKLTRVEDNIGRNLGYREYTVSIASQVLEPYPETVMKPVSSFGADQLQSFADQIGNYGNPVAFFKVTISRLIPESLIRSLSRWEVSRDGYTADCLPVSIEVTDSRYIVILGILKQVTQ